MRRMWSVLACGVAVTAIVGTSAATSTSQTTSATVTVARIVDGDTLTLNDGRRVRLLQIDTPELGTGECYSRAARNALLRLAPVGSRVIIEPDPALDDVDRYGRLLRYVHRGALNVNLELVRAGDAAPYFYRGDRGKYADTLMAAATSARAAKRGLWKSCPRTPLDPAHAIDTGTSGPPPRTASPAPVSAPAKSGCDPNYSGGCVPPYPPDVDCSDIRALGIAPVKVIGSDPHRLDGDHDGWGCE
jgi:endonuclease YncB( thermonuclease family)